MSQKNQKHLNDKQTIIGSKFGRNHIVGKFKAVFIDEHVDTSNLELFDYDRIVVKNDESKHVKYIFWLNELDKE